MGNTPRREELDATAIMTLWSGRFSSSMDEALWNLSESFSFDHVLYHFDIMGSKAHVQGLAHVGLVSDADASLLCETLDAIEQEFQNGSFERKTTDEDIHMAIERRATELCGDVGAKIHTGRSRNDQVATTLRLFTRDSLGRVASEVLSLCESLQLVGEKYATSVLPGYTHLQRAQAVLLSHHLNAHAASLLRDVDRLLATRQRLNVSPLGAGALAGSSLPLDPQFTASLLAFDEAFINSLDAVSDRDFVAETLFDLALIGVHLSRMGEELVLWTSAEFNFATLSDAFTTGSSMLPQKKNSDVAELSRGKSARVIGDLVTLLTLLKGLPLSYNRDLQEDKEPLFDAVRTSLLVLEALRGTYDTMQFNVDVASAAANDELLGAIDIAEELVREGVPFRHAHEAAGRAVRESIANGQALGEYVANDPELSRFAGIFTDGPLVARRTSPGSSGATAAPAQKSAISLKIKQFRAAI